ncbi:hypothetical protein EVAR_63310_1 [Eumeta japonica]|uniref:Uncharacterized protein n=1 Tax=Eumeta variegata TaxID=151549 RepID=A0A4C1YPP0_EUMVA|nr:hypothetical protein EVAR_63310_1 [Eumeta japonica]
MRARSDRLETRLGTIRNIDIGIIALSDSNVALSWMQTAPYQLETFVSNRVAKITENVPVECRCYLPSQLNAADVRSRGITALELVGIVLAAWNRMAHPQEIADSHIHQGARSVKTTNTTSLSEPLHAMVKERRKHS